MATRAQPPVEPQPKAPENPNLLRDRLANERTFLAWLRTGIAITSLGFVVARFDIFLTQFAQINAAAGAPSEPDTGGPASVSIGLMLVLAGPLVVAMAAARYLHTEQALHANRPDSRRLIRSIVMVITVGSVIAGGVLALHLITLWPK